MAAEHGLSRVVADTDRDNLASRLTLERAGFRQQSGATGELCLYEALLDARSTRSR